MLFRSPFVVVDALGNSNSMIHSAQHRTFLYFSRSHLSHQVRRIERCTTVGSHDNTMRLKILMRSAKCTTTTMASIESVVSKQRDRKSNRIAGPCAENWKYSRVMECQEAILERELMCGLLIQR